MMIGRLLRRLERSRRSVAMWAMMRLIASLRVRLRSSRHARGSPLTARMRRHRFRDLFRRHLRGPTRAGERPARVTHDEHEAKKWPAEPRHRSGEISWAGAIVKISSAGAE